MIAKMTVSFATVLNNMKNNNPSKKLKDKFRDFFIIVIIGLILDYVYYGGISLNYLFIGGVKEWFQVLALTINSGVLFQYNTLYLIINGIFYFYLYTTIIQLFILILNKFFRR